MKVKWLISSSVLSWMYCAMSSSRTASASAYAGFPLPPGTSRSWMPASSLYCCQRSDSRISAAARNRRIAASPLGESAARHPPQQLSASNPAPTAPAPTAAPLSKNDRRLADSAVDPMTPPSRTTAGHGVIRGTGHGRFPRCQPDHILGWADVRRVRGRGTSGRASPTRGPRRRAAGPSPVFRKPCGVSGGTTSIWSACSSTASSPAVHRPLPSRRTKVSEYGCTWMSTPFPGGVRTTKTETPIPARGSPSNSAAVGLNFMSSRLKTSIATER